MNIHVSGTQVLELSMQHPRICFSNKLTIRSQSCALHTVTLILDASILYVRLISIPIIDF